MKIEIGKKKLNIQPLKWKDIISLENEHDVTITKLTENMTAAIMAKVLLISVSRADVSVTLEDIEDLPLNHQLFSADVVAFIINGTKPDGKPSDPLG